MIQNMFHRFFDRFGILAGIMVLSGLTLGTSVAGITKVVHGFQVEIPKSVEVKEVTIISPTVNPTPASPNDNQNPPAPTGVKKKSKFSVSESNSIPLSMNANTAVSGGTNEVANNNANRCIVTLFSKKFDVTPLQTSHSGGNIFNCGTDMTAVYQSQHGNDLSRMQPYLVSDNTSGTSNSGSVNNNTSQNSSGGSGTGTSISSSTQRQSVEGEKEDRQNFRERDDEESEKDDDD